MNFKKRIDLLWTFEMATLCLSHIENEKCGLKNYVIVLSKFFFLIGHHKTNNFFLKKIS
jgi:hypothetical protein